MTPFGKYMRNLRLEKGLLLKDVADRLQVTSAYLSALEHGKKGIPSKEFVERIINGLALDAEAGKELKKAVRDSETEFTIPAKVTPFAFETANAFARQLPSLSEIQLKRIKELLDDE
ncbi:MAG TPA: helix-turn-helix transcriptional regulator [Paucimonas sp.]|nr:helix-turn-helix transcriptional regulator [Paucimonas sp.]